jgi:hypothetical protein
MTANASKVTTGSYQMFDYGDYVFIAFGTGNNVDYWRVSNLSSFYSGDMMVSTIVELVDNPVIVHEGVGEAPPNVVGPYFAFIDEIVERLDTIVAVRRTQTEAGIRIK